MTKVKLLIGTFSNQDQMHNLTFGSKYTKSYNRTHFIEKHAAGNMFIIMTDLIYEFGEQLLRTLLFYIQSISMKL